MYVNKEMEEDKGSKKIYLVCGYINSGKDTFSDYIVTKGGWIKLSFGDPLKKMASLKYDIPISHYYSRELKEKPYTTNPKGLGISPRQTCLDIGKEKSLCNHERFQRN